MSPKLDILDRRLCEPEATAKRGLAYHTPKPSDLANVIGRHLGVPVALASIACAMGHLFRFVLWMREPSNMALRHTPAKTISASVGRLVRRGWRRPMLRLACQTMHVGVFPAKPDVSVTLSCSAVGPYQAVVPIIGEHDIAIESRGGTVWRAATQGITVQDESPPMSGAVPEAMIRPATAVYGALRAFTASAVKIAMLVPALVMHPAPASRAPRRSVGVAVAGVDGTWFEGNSHFNLLHGLAWLERVMGGYPWRARQFYLTGGCRV